MRGRERRHLSGVATFGAVWAALVTIALVVLNEPSLALSFLYLVPVCLAAYAVGRPGAVVAGVAATGVFVVDELLRPSGQLDDTASALPLAAGVRLLVLCGTGLLVAHLLSRQERLSRTIEAQQLEIAELTALREALTPAALPSVAGLLLGAAYVPAEGHVAGDFYLVFSAGDGSTFLALGDVAGHGLSAARLASFVRTTLLTLAGYATDPGELLRLANAAVYERVTDPEVFVTVCCARVMPQDGRAFVWAQAGHPGPWNLDSARPLDGRESCPPLGVSRELSCTTQQAELGPDGGVLLMSDGLLEARPAADGRRPFRLFGADAIRAELLRHRGATPDNVAAALAEAAVEFAGGALGDDLTVLAARFRP